MHVKEIITYTLIITTFLFVSGCAGQRIHKKGEPEKPFKKVLLKSTDIIEIRYVRTNIKTSASETLTLTKDQARIEREGGRAFEPQSMPITEEEFMELARMAVSISWKVNPKPYVINPDLKEEIILKTQDNEEKVVFEEQSTGRIKEFNIKIRKIRSNVYKYRK